MNVNANSAASTGTEASQQTAASASSELSRFTNSSVFMQLLVAQIKYQNPMSPVEGVEFVTQLAQLSQVEETTTSRKELQAIRDILMSSVQVAEEPPVE